MSITLQRYEISKKRIALFAIFAVVLAFICSLTTFQTAHANMYTSFKELNLKIIEEALYGPGDMVSEIFFKDGESNVLGMIDDINNGIPGITDSLKILGIGFGIILFAIKLATELQNGQDVFQQLLKILTEFLICVIIILYSEDIVNGVTGLGDMLIGLFTQPSGARTVDSAEVLEQIRTSGGYDNNRFGMLAVFLKLLPISLFSFILSILCRVAAYSVLIEICVRQIFISFAIMDVGYEGLRSNGFRYIKKYLACFFKVAIMLMVCLVAATLSIDDSTADEIYIIRVLALNLCSAALLFKSADWANDIVGA